MHAVQRRDARPWPAVARERSGLAFAWIGCDERLAYKTIAFAERVIVTFAHGVTVANVGDRVERGVGSSGAFVAMAVRLIDCILDVEIDGTWEGGASEPPLKGKEGGPER